jgi:hypothetical protein
MPKGWDFGIEPGLGGIGISKPLDSCICTKCQSPISCDVGKQPFCTNCEGSERHFAPKLEPDKRKFAQMPPMPGTPPTPGMPPMMPPTPPAPPPQDANKDKNKKDEPELKKEYESEEYKQIADPNEYKAMSDPEAENKNLTPADIKEIEKSCLDLAIDG